MRAAHAAEIEAQRSRGDPPRTHFVATRNAFEHIGAVSSLRTTGLSHTPECGTSLTSFLWATERFRDAAACAEVGVVPCARARDVARVKNDERSRSVRRSSRGPLCGLARYVL